MAQSRKAEAILAALEAQAPKAGLDIVSVEVGGSGKRPIVRVRIDTLGDDPIDMDTVTRFTPWVSQIVEELDPFTDAYDLEVSSPGLDRPLRRIEDFSRFMGSEASIALNEMVEGRMKGTGAIAGVDGDLITIEIDGSPWSFPLSALKVAKIKPDYAAIFAQAKAQAAGDRGDDSAD